MNGSLHYQGKAFDLRTWHVIEEVAKQLRTYLGKDYDVIVEKDHIHVEYDPKQKVIYETEAVQYRTVFFCCVCESCVGVFQSCLGYAWDFTCQDCVADA